MLALMCLVDVLAIFSRVQGIPRVFSKLQPHKRQRAIKTVQVSFQSKVWKVLLQAKKFLTFFVFMALWAVIQPSFTSVKALRVNFGALYSFRPPCGTKHVRTSSHKKYCLFPSAHLTSRKKFPKILWLNNVDKSKCNGGDFVYHNRSTYQFRKCTIYFIKSFLNTSKLSLSARLRFSKPLPSCSSQPSSKRIFSSCFSSITAVHSFTRTVREQFPFARADTPDVLEYGEFKENQHRVGLGSEPKHSDRDKSQKPMIYFDNAATTQKPQRVLQALYDAYVQQNANVHRAVYARAAAATERLESVRDQLAKYIGAERPEEIVFTSGATDAINLVAQSWGQANIQEGDEILLSVAEHHSNLVPWQLLAACKKAFLKFIQLNEQFCISVPSVLSALSPRTKLVAFSHTSNVLGSHNPFVQDVIRAVKRYNPSIVVLLDATQALPHLQLSVRDLQCDFLAGSAHKMYGPTGVGFLYGKYSTLEKMPPWKGGGEMIEQVGLYNSTYAEPPARFEAGTPPFIQIAGLGAALDFLDSLGMPNVVAHELQLYWTLRNALESHIPSLRLLVPDAGSMSASPDVPSQPSNATSNDFTKTSTNSCNLNNCRRYVNSLPIACDASSAALLASGTAKRPISVGLKATLSPIPLISFAHPILHSQDIAAFLDVFDNICVRSGHHCCQPLHRHVLHLASSCRISLAVYNTEGEIDRFVKSLKSVIQMLERQR